MLIQCCFARIHTVGASCIRNNRFLAPVKKLTMASNNITFQVNIGSGKLENEDFNERGYFRPSRHALRHEQARIAALMDVLKGEAESFLKENTFFLRHQNVLIDDNIRPTSNMLSEPIHGTFTLKYLGTSSALCKSQLILEKDNSISTCIAQVICVNIKSRRPAPLPKSFTEMYADANTTTKPKIAPLLEPPQSMDQQIYRKAVVVNEEDVDSNKHMNQAAYVKFCVHTARNAIADKMFPNITEDILDCRPRSLTSEYLGETLKGDELNYLMWQDLENEYLFHFEAKKTDKPVFRCHLDFNK